MCGITILWGKNIDRAAHKQALDALGPRGPDAANHEFLTHLASGTEISIGFARLHIQGERDGAEQPFDTDNGRIVLCNGEIFNSDLLIKQLDLQVPEGSSDCAVIPALLNRGLSLAEVARQLDGDFAIVVLDPHTGGVQVARDPYGVRPLFYAEWTGVRGVASELKGLLPDATYIQAIEPGTVVTMSFTTDTRETVVWHQPPWLKIPAWRSSTEGSATLRHALEEAVAKRLITVREVGACLSGGLDSSLVAAIAARSLACVGKRLHTYSIGMDGSPDLEHARLVADHIGSIHHERIITAEECLAAIPDVVKAIESFDITTVRASVGNYLLGQFVATETPLVKVVLNGDGADEVLGGYLYMRAAHDDAAFEVETDRLLSEIHRYDVLRSERSMAAHGLESRSPCLDRQFVAVARGLPTDMLRPGPTKIEKFVLRQAFDTGLLPEKVLWRRKEAFSDGISRAEKSWFESAKAAGEAIAINMDATTYKINPPPTAEALWYRTLFHQHYPATAAATIPAMWMPRFINATDPSARTLSLYQA